MINVHAVTSPEVTQQFNKSMISVPLPKFREDSEDLMRLYLYIQEMHKRKSKSGKINEKQAVVRGLSEKFLEIYATIKTKEEELEKENPNRIKEPWYLIDTLNEIGRELLRRSEFGKNDGKKSLFNRRDHAFY